MHCIALYHIGFEDLGSFDETLRRRGYDISYRHAGAEPLSLDEWRGADLVVVLGGPLGVNDIGSYPWLADELAGLRARLDRALPTLGICLGAQLMAAALGGRVETRFAGKEIGWSTLVLADAPGAFAGLANVPVLHWHGDNIVPPAQVTPLASTEGTPCQAFAVGSHALGLQFHCEFASARIEEWLAGHAVELAHAGIDLTSLRDGALRHGPMLERAGAELLQRWLDGL